MQTTSALYNQILTETNHTFEVKLEIGGVVYGMDSLLSLETNCKVFDNKPTIGGVYSATCQFSFLGNGQNIPRMAQCIPFFRITNGTDTSEWIKKGVFYIDTREVTKNGDGLDVFSAFCYDGMMMANSDYSTSELEWPATDANVVEEICSQIGVLQDPRNASIMTEAYSIPFPAQYTKRDVLSYIAAMYGANWIMTDEGKLRLIPMTGNADSIDIGKSLMGLNVSPTRPPFTQVVLMVSDTDTVISGNNQSNVIDAYCPFATQAVADRVYSILSTWSYHPFTAEGVWANPALELGDQFTANENTATVFSRDLHFGSGMIMALSAPVEEYIDHEYAYESPSERHYKQTLGDIRREIVVTAESITSTISRRIDNMQEQIDNNIETFTGSAVPTLTNYPANAWTTTEEKDKHIGDLYVVNSQGGDYEGFYYRFEKVGSTYQWRLLKDTEVTKALAEAEEALRRVGIAETQIEQNAEAITLRATKTEAQGYANTAQANAISAAATDATTKANVAESAAKSYADAQITVSAEAITSNVSATYETKSDATTKLNTAKTYAEGQAAAAESNANDYTDNKLTDYSTTTQMESAIEQTASSITSTVSATYETKVAATQKLNTAKSYAETQAADAEAAAVSAAAADAATKANAAEAGAKGYTDNKLTGYSTTTQMNSAISQSAGSILQTVSETYTTKAEFENLNVGGINYLLGTQKMAGWPKGGAAVTVDDTGEYAIATLTGSSSNWSTALSVSPARDISILDGSSFTFSMQYSVTTDTIFSVVLASTARTPGSASGARTKYATFRIQTIPSTDGAWKTWSYTVDNVTPEFMTSGSGDQNSWYITVYCRTQDAVLRIQKLKFEKGNRATDWSPAPEDISKGAIDYTNEALTSYTTKTELASSLETTTEGILGTVSETYTTKTEFANLEIGGRNHLQFSDDPESWGWYTPTKYAVAKIFLYSNLVKEKKYTLTVYGQAPTRSDKTDCFYGIYWGGGVINLGRITMNNGRGVLTFTAPNSEHADAQNAWIQIYNTPLKGASGTTYSAEITKVKLEEGDKATDWTPAPEDIEHEFTEQKQAILDITSDEITAAVTKSEEGQPIVNLLPSVYWREAASSLPYTTGGVKWTLNADGSLTAQLADGATAATANSYFVLTGNLLTNSPPVLTVNPSKKHVFYGCPPGGSSTTYRMIVQKWTEDNPPTGATGSTSYDYGSGVKLAAGFKWLYLYCAIAKNYAFPDGPVTFYPMLEVGQIAHGYVSSHNGSGTLTERIKSAEASISVQADQIASKVSTTDYNGNKIASLINQNATTIQINAQKIDLQGAVSFTSFDTATKDALVTNTTTKNQYAQSTSDTTAPTSGWGDTIPVYNASKKYIWIRVSTTKTYAGGESETTTSTPTVDKNLSSAIEAAASAQSTANSAIGTTKSTQQYYLSTSATSTTGGSWVDTVPTWAANRYVWTRMKTESTQKDGTALTPVYSTAVYDKNLTTALSTASSASSAASAAQTKANAALVTSVSVYFRASTSTVPGKPTAEVTSTAVDTSDAWTLCMPRPKKETTYYTCEQNKDGNGTVSWTAVMKMENTTYVANWASSANATYIDGANIYTGTVTADKIAANEVFTQKLYASDFNILGGSVHIEANGGMADEVTLTYDGVKNSMMPYGYVIYDENYASSPMVEITHTFGTNYKSALITLREINGSGTESKRIELKPSGVLYYYDSAKKFFLGGTGLALFDSNGNNTANYSNYSVTLTNGAKSVLNNTSLSFYGSGGGLLSELSQTKLTITNLKSVELTNTGLVFKNASNAVTAAYNSAVKSAEYTPSNDTLTFLSSSRIYVFKSGTHGNISVQVNIQNGGDFATETEYTIATLPTQYRPKYKLRQMVTNQHGTSACMVSIGTDGVVTLYRYANSAAWISSWIRVEIPAIFANP